MRGLSIVMSALVLAGASIAWSADTTQSSGVKVVKDRDTGKLRAPTREEDQSLAVSDKAKRETSVRVNPDGSVTALLGDEHLSDVVAVKNADGSITTTCVPHGEE